MKPPVPGTGTTPRGTAAFPDNTASPLSGTAASPRRTATSPTETAPSPRSTDGFTSGTETCTQDTATSPSALGASPTVPSCPSSSLGTHLSPKLRFDASRMQCTAAIQATRSRSRASGPFALPSWSLVTSRSRRTQTASPSAPSRSGTFTGARRTVSRRVASMQATLPKAQGSPQERGFGLPISRQPATKIPRGPGKSPFLNATTP